MSFLFEKSRQGRNVYSSYGPILLSPVRGDMSLLTELDLIGGALAINMKLLGSPGTTFSNTLLHILATILLAPNLRQLVLNLLLENCTQQCPCLLSFCNLIALQLFLEAAFPIFQSICHRCLPLNLLAPGVMGREGRGWR